MVGRSTSLLYARSGRRERLIRLRRLGYVAVLAMTALAVLVAPAQAATWGQIQNKFSTKCVDEKDQDRQVNGAHVQQWDCKSVSNQRWLPVQQPNGFFQLISERSGKCLMIDGRDTRSGALAVVWDCIPGDRAQQWNRVRNPFPNATNSSWLVNVNSEKCLEIPGWNTGNGLFLAQSDCVGGHKQYWNTNF